MFEHKCWLYPVIRATCPYMCSLCKNDNETFTINELSQKSFNYTELQNLIDNTLIKFLFFKIYKKILNLLLNNSEALIYK